MAVGVRHRGLLALGQSSIRARSNQKTSEEDRDVVVQVVQVVLGSALRSGFSLASLSVGPRLCAAVVLGSSLGGATSSCGHRCWSGWSRARWIHGANGIQTEFVPRRATAKLCGHPQQAPEQAPAAVTLAGSAPMSPRFGLLLPSGLARLQPVLLRRRTLSPPGAAQSPLD